MNSSAKVIKTLKFGEFAVDLRAGELLRRGKKVKVQQQPMQVLVALLEAPGGVVTREELRERIWPADTFVDFEHSLNTAIKKLRQALGDRATKSKFIETLPRRGYRFLPAVTAVEGKAPLATVSTGRLAGKVFSVRTEEGTECVLGPVDGESYHEWERLKRLGDDVGISMMIAEKRLLLLAVRQTVRLLSMDPATSWCEVRILEGEHYGKTALVDPKFLQEVPAAKAE
jgi:DNA-binding winged helix-turn-helix (wHTH) protein